MAGEGAARSPQPAARRRRRGAQDRRSLGSRGVDRVAREYRLTRASVIVLSWNGEQYLPSCLAALAAQIGPDDELIVVDNGSTDDSVSLVRTQFRGATLIENGRNLGFAGGANVGLQAARGACLLLVNQDVVVGAGWLDGILAVLGQAEVGVTGCKLLYPDGRIQHAGGVLRYPLALPDHHGYRQRDRGQCDQQREVDYVTGAAMGVPRRVLDDVGAFDEGFHPAFYEEVDLCARARAAGYQIVYAPQAVATHHETTSVLREGADYHRWMARGRLRYVLKHYSASQFHRDFAPAERLWGASLTVPEMREGLRLAYLDTLLGLRAIPRTGVLADAGSEETVAETLASLRGALTRLSGPARGSGAPAPQDVHSAEPQPSASVSGPATGGQLQARLRALRSRIVGKWYVRHLLLRVELGLAQETVAALDREATEAYRLFGQAIYGLREALDRLEDRLAALEARAGDRGQEESG